MQKKCRDLTHCGKYSFINRGFFSTHNNSQSLWYSISTYLTQLYQNVESPTTLKIVQRICRENKNDSNSSFKKCRESFKYLKGIGFLTFSICLYESKMIPNGFKKRWAYRPMVHVGVVYITIVGFLLNFIFNN